MNGERLGLSLGGSGRTRTSDIICILSHYTDRSSQLRYGTMCVPPITLYLYTYIYNT